MNTLRRAVPAIFFVMFIVSSCTHTHIPEFSFTDRSGTDVRLKQKPSVRNGEGARLLSTELGYSSPCYYPVKGIEHIEPDTGLYVEYSGKFQGKMIIEYGEYREEYLFPETETGTAKAVFPLRPGVNLTAFRIEGSRFFPEWRILSAGLTTYFNGVSIYTGTPELATGFGMYYGDSGDVYIGTVGEEGLSLYLRYSLLSDFPAIGDNGIEITDEEGMPLYSVLPLPGSHKVYIPLQGFTGTVHVKDTGILDQFAVVENKEKYTDMGVMIHPQHQLQGEYEFYRWTDFPDILLIDFLDYQIQAKFFKRLAFFVEKRGFAGILLGDDVLERLHGWNAHDYRASDLARFFTLAGKTGIQLNSHEYELLDILLQESIIAHEEGSYLPVSGGILSISRESPPYLRQLFLAHEGYHGIFFSMPEYVDEAFTIYHSLNEDFRAFWNMFLRWKYYDTSNTYLLVNEIQAYLLQQPLERVNRYFMEYTISQMRELFPEAENFLLPMTEPDWTYFYDTALKLHEFIQERTGYGAGNLFSVKAY